jgi:hypothetical protein
VEIFEGLVLRMKTKQKLHIKVGHRTNSFSAIATNLQTLDPYVQASHISSLLRVSVLFNIRNAELYTRHVEVFHRIWPWLNGVVLVDYYVTLVLSNCTLTVKEFICHTYYVL